MQPTTTPQDNHYHDEISALADLYKSHPEFFAGLSTKEMDALRTYYLVDQDMPEDTLAYRDELLALTPYLETDAQAAYARVRSVADSTRE